MPLLALCLITQCTHRGSCRSTPRSQNATAPLLPAPLRHAFEAALALLPRGGEAVVIAGEIDAREGLQAAVDSLKVGLAFVLFFVHNTWHNTCTPSL